MGCIEDKIKSLNEMRQKSLQKVRCDERFARLERARLLNLNPDSKMDNIEFVFDLDLKLREGDEDIVNTVLTIFGTQRYPDERWRVYETEPEFKGIVGWEYSELRWPAHYAAYVESISVFRADPKIKIEFIREKITLREQATLLRYAKNIFAYITCEFLKRKHRDYQVNEIINRAGL